MVAMKNGFARGVFSNEAGLGSAPIAPAAPGRPGGRRPRPATSSSCPGRSRCSTWGRPCGRRWRREIVTLANGKANDFVWGPIMLALLVGTGVFLTFRTGWLQVRRFGYIMKNTRRFHSVLHLRHPVNELLQSHIHAQSSSRRGRLKVLLLRQAANSSHSAPAGSRCAGSAIL